MRCLIAYFLYFLVACSISYTYLSLSSKPYKERFVKNQRALRPSSDPVPTQAPRPAPRVAPTVSIAPTIVALKDASKHACNDHVVFTTFKCPKCDGLRKTIEDNTAHVWSEMKGVTFRPLKNTKTNKHGVPILGSMYMEVMRQCPFAKTYTYVNGDIIGTSEFVHTINAVLHIGEFLMVGRRTNVKWDKKHSVKHMNYSFDSHFEKGALFQTDAQDYFTVTKRAIDWESIPPFVIGRPAYDNWLVNHIYHNPSVALIDATKTVRMVHQTDEDGNGAHGGRMVKSKADKQYNRILGKGQWDHGRTTHAQWETSYDTAGKIVLLDRRIQQSKTKAYTVVQFLNTGFLEMTKSWICNVKKFNILPDTVFIATDQKAYDGLRAFDTSLKVRFVPYSAPDSMSYGHSDYYKYMLFRTRQMIKMMQKETNIFLTEADAVWLKDPLPRILSKKADIVTVNDARKGTKRQMSGGFQFIHPTAVNKRLFRALEKELSQSLKNKHGEMGNLGSDQIILNKLIHEHRAKVVWLSSDEFVAGWWYESKHTDTPYIIQNNWIVGNEAKIKRAKQYNHWYLNDTGSCRGSEKSTSIQSTVTISGKEIHYKFPKKMQDIRTDIVVGVLSYDANKRQLIRNFYKDETIYFIVGKKNGKFYMDEFNKYQDMILIDKEESYMGEDTILPYKTQVFSHAVHSTVGTYEYALKIDDDSLVQFEPLRKELRQTKPDYWGRVWHNSGVIRDPKSKWFVSKSTYSPDRYPDYCSGAGYALSKEANACIVGKLPTLRFMPREDVATGILAQQCGIKAVSSMKVKPVKSYNGDDYIIRHYVNLEEQLKQQEPSSDWCKTHTVLPNGAFCSKKYAGIDTALAKAIVEIIPKGSTITDLGAGGGWYTDYFNENGLKSFAYDASPVRPKNVKFIDLTETVKIPNRDWTLCLEVGEHLPKKFETTFLNNVAQTSGVVLSWAVPGQGGNNHVNLQDNPYVINKMKEYGYTYQEQDSTKLRKASTFSWFKNTVMVFRVDAINKSIGWHKWCIPHLRRNLTFSKFADKLNVKQYVQTIAPEVTVPKTFTSVSNSEDITEELLSSLPNKYVMKGTHGSGMTVIVNGGALKCHGMCSIRSGTNETRVEFLRKNCGKWLSYDYGRGGELYYSKIPFNCIFEEFIPQNNDYKFHTFHGTPMFIQHDTSRFKGHKRTFYTPSWKQIMMRNKVKRIDYETDIHPLPKHLDLLVKAATKLAKGFTMVRVDLYLNDDKVFFSEFSAGLDNCMGEFSPETLEKYYGYVALHPEIKHDPEYVLQLL